MKKHILDKCELVEESGQFYVSLVYIIEDDTQIRKVVIPRAKLPINRGVCPDIDKEHSSILDLNPTYFINAGYGSCIMPLDKHDGYYYTVELLKEKPRKMTVPEIEKALGYKVEIVS